MALSAARNTWFQRTRLGDTLRVPMAKGARVFQGGGVCINGAGYAVPAADSPNFKGAGVAVEDPQNPGRSVYDNSAGQNGDMYVVVMWAGRFRFKLGSPVMGLTPDQSMMSAWVYWLDDETVAVHKFDANNDIGAGVIMRLPGATLALDEEADFGTDEVEIELFGEPFMYGVGMTTCAPTTTTAAATTTTTPGGI